MSVQQLMMIFLIQHIHSFILSSINIACRSWTWRTRGL